MDARIRAAANGDAGAIAVLTSQLGYPSTASETARRLACLLASSDQLLLVTCDEADRPVGWIHVGERTLLEGDAYHEILGLVVDADHRREGRAAALVAAGERWARDRGSIHLFVRSNILRAESHPFYERAGYERVKTQHVYRKRLV